MVGIREYRGKCINTGKWFYGHFTKMEKGTLIVLMALVEEVLKVWNEDGDCGEIQKITPIAWHRVLRKAEKVLGKSD